MTTIIMKTTPQGVHIGYDSALTGQDQTNSADPKVFTNNGIIIGVAGNTPYSTELRYTELPELIGDPARWLTKEFVPFYKELLERVEPDKDKHDVMLLICTPGAHIFEVAPDGGWDRNTPGVYAIGSGRTWALGALGAGSTILDALRISATRDPFTGGTLHTTTAADLLNEQASTFTD